MKRIYTLLSGLVMLNLVYGPLVRATDSGLACPDWPLCHGKFVPEWTFQIFMEVGHRYYSGALGLLILGAFVYVWKDPVRKKKYGILSLLTLLFLGSQVVLGALTVTKLLDPKTVNLHLLNAILLLTLCYTIVLRENNPRTAFRWEGEGKWFLPLFGILVLYQIFLGAKVSTNYAGLACPDFPRCYGDWFPEPVGIIRYQLEHRYFGYLVACLVFGAAIWSIFTNQSVLVKRWLKISSYLILLQILLGAINVIYLIPKGITALHTLNAAMVFLSFYTACFHQFQRSQ